MIWGEFSPYFRKHRNTHMSPSRFHDSTSRLQVPKNPETLSTQELVVGGPSRCSHQFYLQHFDDSSMMGSTSTTVIYRISVLKFYTKLCWECGSLVLLYRRACYKTLVTALGCFLSPSLYLGIGPKDFLQMSSVRRQLLRRNQRIKKEMFFDVIGKHFGQIRRHTEKFQVDLWLNALTLVAWSLDQIVDSSVIGGTSVKVDPWMVRRCWDLIFDWTYLTQKIWVQESQRNRHCAIESIRGVLCPDPLDDEGGVYPSESNCFIGFESYKCLSWELDGLGWPFFVHFRTWVCW